MTEIPNETVVLQARLDMLEENLTRTSEYLLVAETDLKIAKQTSLRTQESLGSQLLQLQLRVDLLENPDKSDPMQITKDLMLQQETLAADLAVMRNKMRVLQQQLQDIQEAAQLELF